MAYFKTLVFTCLLLSMLFSCTKEKPGLTVTSPFYIPMGSTIFSVQKMDSVVEGYSNSIRYFRIDLDKDGIADFELTSNIEHKCEYDGKQSYLNCLNNQSYILGNITSDTTYRNIKDDTTFFSSGAQKITAYETIGCEKIFENCIINSVISALHPIFLNLGDTLSTISPNWINGNSELYRGPKFNYEPYRPDAPNNEYHFARYYSCHYSIPNNQTLYFGLKKETKGKPVLGWIKLSLSDNYIIRIYELATQK